MASKAESWRRPLCTARPLQVSSNLRTRTYHAAAHWQQALLKGTTNPFLLPSQRKKHHICSSTQAEPIKSQLTQADSTAAIHSEDVDSCKRQLGKEATEEQSLSAPSEYINPSRRHFLSAAFTAAGGGFALEHGPSKAEAAGLLQGPPSKRLSPPLTKAAPGCSQTGVSALRNPILNQGLVMSNAERKSLGIEGLLPAVYEEAQVEMERALYNLDKCANDLQRYQYLVTLKETNEDCFYALLVERPQEMLPLVYTPTVGDACLNFGTLSPRPLALYVSLADRTPERMKQIVSNWPESDVRIAVITDGERILGLGDLGVHGQGIPVGKCMVYTACGGISPRHLLPITVDVGTNNEELRTDPFYLGQRTVRARGAEYDELLDSLVRALQQRYGDSIVIHWEDLGASNSWRLLERFSERHVCTFNDDIQATAAVVLAGILSALRITKGKLRDQRFLLFGAGQASIGTADQVIYALTREGVPEAEARGSCWQFDSRGLIYRGRSSLTDRKAAYAHPLPAEPFDPTSLKSCIEALKPTVLIGAAGVPGAFDDEVLKSMAEVNERPVVFALSNPATKSECTAWDAVRETQGRVVFASGSPFKPIVYNNQLISTGFANNAFIFPGVGLGTISSGATVVTDEMLFAAILALASCVTEEDLKAGSVYPPASRIRDTALSVAASVAASAASEMVASSLKSSAFCYEAGSGSEVSAWRQCIERQLYVPKYLSRTP